MIAACQENKVRWLDATGWLHHERTRTFADWFQNKKLGKLVHITTAVSFYEPFQSGEHRLNPELGGGCLLDLGWYAAGAIRFAVGRLPRAVNADTIIRHGVSQRLTAMLWFDDDVTATISCGYDSSTRKWFEVAGSAASLICDDFTRPWPDRPTRCWIHDATGQVEPEEFSDSQERSMIEKLIRNESLEDLQRQALDTQRTLDALQRSSESGERVLL